MAAGATQFALLVDQFLATLQTIAPVLPIAWLGNWTFIAGFLARLHPDKKFALAADFVEGKVRKIIEAAPRCER